MSVPKLKYTYFPIGGRSTIIRAACALKGIELERENVDFGDWFSGKVSGDRSRFPLGDLPVLTIDGTTKLCESVAITQYIGQITGYWPQDALASAQGLMILSAIEQIFTGTPDGDGDMNLIRSMKLQGEEQVAARQGPVSSRIKFFLGAVENMVGTDGFAVGKEFSMVDFQIWFFVNGLNEGAFDHIPKDIAAPFKNVQAVVAKINADAKIVEMLKVNAN